MSSGMHGTSWAGASGHWKVVSEALGLQHTGLMNQRRAGCACWIWYGKSDESMTFSIHSVYSNLNFIYKANLL